jgi:hypothetical protein
LVLSKIIMTLKQPEGIRLSNKFKEVAMKNAARYRALASLCRQQAAYNPDKSWRLLGQAEQWEHLAEAELVSHFKECNADRPVYSTDNVEPENVDGSRWETIAAA